MIDPQDDNGDGGFPTAGMGFKPRMKPAKPAKSNYRLLKVVKADGFVTWHIQRWRWFPPMWEFVDCTIHERNARELLARLRAGVPYQKEEVIG